MKLLLVLGSDESRKIISQNIEPLGFELIHYRYVLKAMDNVDEINPTAIIVSARDFPRHWKILVQFVRSERPKESCPIIIMKGPNFSNEEASKAFFLGVSGIIDEALDKPEEIDRLQGILGRYVQVNDKRRERRIRVEDWQQFGFLFCRPDDNVIISGSVKSISRGGMAFIADEPAMLENIKAGTELAQCSLRAGGDILSPVCRLVRANSKSVSLKFVSFPGIEGQILNQYLDDLPAGGQGSKKSA